MLPETDHSPSDLERIKPALRGDLVFTPELSGPEPHYRLEDPLKSKFYRLGLAEYTFVSLLDGATSIRDALRMTVTAGCALSEQDAAAISRWLIEKELAHTAASGGADQLAARRQAAERRQAWSRWNPLIIRLPLCHPDRFLAAVTPRLSWMFSPWAWAACAVLLLLSAGLVAASWDRFATSCSAGFLAPGNWLWLAVCWLLLKLIHELAHAIVCEKYGGFVREAGVILVLFAPIAYVDATSSWRFRSKWQRIHTAAAGMYIELLVAALAALVWCRTSPGPVNHICLNLVVMAGVTTILFNANPLMKFDGYFILSDLLGMPNLYVSAQQCLHRWAQKNLLGIDAAPLPWSGPRRWFFLLYGVASLLWRVFVSVSLAVAAAVMFHGAGIVLAVLALLLWLAVPALRFAGWFLWSGAVGPRERLRLVTTATCGLLATAGLLGFVRWPAANHAPAIVAYAQLAVVRANSAGFVDEVRVSSGQFVEQGQILAVLRNEQLDLDLAELDLAVEQSRIKCRMFEQSGQLAARQAELKNLETLQQQRREKQLLVDQLVVRAERSGTVLGRGLDLLVGTYVESGSELMSIGDEARKQLRGSVSQDDVEVYATRVGNGARVTFPGVRPFTCSLVEVSPRASLEPADPSLCASAGGALPVINRGEQLPQGGGRYELLAPRFTATFELTAQQSRRLRAGQRGWASIRSWDEPLGRRCYELMRRWLREKTHPGGGVRS